MKKTVVHILSTSFAGSHYLSLLLGSHSRAVHAGELFQLKRTNGMMLGEVYFTDNQVFEGIGPHNIQDVYEIIFSRVSPDTDVLVDTSKVIKGWSEMFVEDTRCEHKYIHLIRDPRALVRRWMLSEDGKPQESIRWRIRSKMLRSWPQVPLKAAFTDTSSLLMYQWLQKNQDITAFLQKHHLDMNTVTYCDLAKNTEGELSRLMDWIGLKIEPGQCDYWNSKHIGTQKRKYEWIKEKKTTYFDLRWKKDLSPDIQARISRDGCVNRYLDALGLRISDDGLTQAASPGVSATAGQT
jgi:hypothetical protein